MIHRLAQFHSIVVLIVICSIGAPHFGFAQSNQKPKDYKQQGEKKSKRSSKKSLKSHCVNKVMLRFNEIYMTGDWLKKAKTLAQSKWRKQVAEQYGSVYSEWSKSTHKHSKCARIGFGNDPGGNVGSTILCEISATPCVTLHR